MPELPEVETIANGVHRRVQGDSIVSVWTSDKPQTFKTPPALLAETLTGSRIERVHRVGKTIVVDLVCLPDPCSLIPVPCQCLIHLGMTGRLLVSSADVPLSAHTHLIATLRSGRELRFVDARRFGRLSIAQSTEEKFKGTGREPLTISLEEFIALFRGRKTSIKAALLNQKLLHGVGNIYADEGLFLAGIRPTRHAGRLSRAELKRLNAALKKVLRHAIRLGGSSVADYVDADGVRGFFQLRHNVYLRTGEPCRACGTAIRRTIVAGRGTHFCPKCQY
jgi:formamidopyrimidine-DNA glycosylase